MAFIQGMSRGQNEITAGPALVAVGMRLPVARLPRQFAIRDVGSFGVSAPSRASRASRRRVGDLGLMVVANLWRDDPALRAALAHEGLVRPRLGRLALFSWLRLGRRFSPFFCFLRLELAEGGVHRRRVSLTSAAESL